MTDGKITGFEVLPKGKGAVVRYTDNVIEDGEMTYKEYVAKVERKPSSDVSTIMRVLLGHGLYNLGMTDGVLTEKDFKSRKIVDAPEFKHVRFKGFTISGDGEDEKVSIKMEITCKNDEVVALTSGKIAIADGSYVYDDLLASDLEQAIAEVNSFIEGENYYKEAELPFPDAKAKVEDEL